MLQQRVAFQQQLAVANDKIRKLQNECKYVMLHSPYFAVLILAYFYAPSLLLDAVDIAAPSQENISYYLKLDPVPPQYDLQRRNLPLGAQPPDPTPPSPPPSTHARSHSREITSTNGTNGHSHRRVSLTSVSTNGFVPLREHVLMLTRLCQ